MRRIETERLILDKWTTSEEDIKGLYEYAKNHTQDITSLETEVGKLECLFVIDLDFFEEFLQKNCPILYDLAHTYATDNKQLSVFCLNKNGTISYVGNSIEKQSELSSWKNIAG